jgi:hypothetical protein
MAKIDLTEYVGKNVTVVTTAQTGYKVETEEGVGIKIKSKKSNEDNFIVGHCTEAYDDGLIVVNKESKSRTYTYTVLKNQICAIRVTELTEYGLAKHKERSKRMKEMHANRSKAN